jgi:hypothetical protein
MRLNKEFSERVTIFHGIRLPEVALPVGYAALIDAYNLLVPLPYKLSCIGHSHRKREEGGWVYYTPRHTPAPTLGGQLAFALKNEGVDLAVLKSLFIQVKAPEIEKIIKDTPTGIYARRIWFLYEWLNGSKTQPSRSQNRKLHSPARSQTYNSPYPGSIVPGKG